MFAFQFGIGQYRVGFGSPWWLLLALVLVPLLSAWSLRRLEPLGRVRAVWVTLLRSLVLLCVILALAEVQMVRTTDRVAVLYVLDQSQSIPESQRQAMLDYVNAEVAKHRREGDKAGVIVFGREAAIEIPPFDETVPIVRVESELDPDYTNLADALKLAKATFPEDSAKRVVVLSDGNQNLGDALEQARGLAAAGVGIDVLPVHYQTRKEVLVERLVLPGEVRRGEPFDLRVVLNNTAQPTEGRTGEVHGRLRISQLAGDQTVVLSEQPVTLPPGKKVFTLRQEVDAPSFYTYEARFIPDGPDDDGMPQNNRATAFTQIRGKGRVLLIEDYQQPGEFTVLAKRLLDRGLEVEVRGSAEAFSRLDQLQAYDTVILANVPREHFSDDQIAMLVRNTQQLGAGLVMLGGPNSFGAGGWAGTPVEEAMPVDFQIKAAKVVPRGALVMIMHACEIAQGNFWQKKIAIEALKTLGPRDYCGLIHWNGTEQWLWGKGLLPVGPNRAQMLKRIDFMTPGDMPDFEPSMQMARLGFAAVPDAAVRHMIIISDGDPTPPSGSVLRALRDMKVTVSTVAVGAHGAAGSRVLLRIADQTGGKYHVATSPKALPRIFQREARRVARPLIWDKQPVRPRVKFAHPVVEGIDDPLPPIRGFVLTEKKDNPLVETLIVSPLPAGDRSNTILAVWTYGLGRTAAFTSDAGARWTTAWAAQYPEVYDTLFDKIVRWTMRPVGDLGKFSVATRAEDGRVEVIVTALDKKDEFLNFLAMTGTVVGPDLEPLPLELEQVAPGRYVGSFPTQQSGSYLVNVAVAAPTADGAGGEAGAARQQVTSLRAGVNVPYSEEFRARVPNEALLRQLAALKPRAGEVGRVIGTLDANTNIELLLAGDTFRRDLPKATSIEDIWFYVVFLGCCVFFWDVFFRRVQVSFEWLKPVAAEVRDLVLRRERVEAPAEAIVRLSSRKAEVRERFEQLRAGARFEPSADVPAEPSAFEEPGPQAGKPRAPEAPGAPAMTEEPTREESYTERLLRAKKRIWEKRRRKGRDQ